MSAHNILHQTGDLCNLVDVQNYGVGLVFAMLLNESVEVLLPASCHDDGMPFFNELLRQS